MEHYFNIPMCCCFTFKMKLKTLLAMMEGKEEGFLASQRIMGKEACVQPSCSMLNQARLSWGRVAVHVSCFVLDVCLGRLTLFPLLRPLSPAPTFSPHRIIRRRLENHKLTIIPFVQATGKCQAL